MVIVRCSRCSTGYRMDPTRVPAAGVRVRCPSCGHVFRVRLRPQSPEPVPSEAASGQEIGREAGPSPQAANPSSVLPGLQQESASFFGSSSTSAAPAAPDPPAATKPKLSPPSWSSGERTIDFDAPVDSPAAAPKPRSTLETAPFRPGGPPPATAPVTRPPATTPSSPPPQTLHAEAPPVVPSVSVPTQNPGMSGDHQRARRLARVLVSDIMVYNQESRDKALAEGNLVTVLAGEVNKAWELYKSKVEAVVLEESDYFKDALNEILADGWKVY